MSVPDERYIKVGSVHTRYWMEGEGSPVILVHGLGGSATGWLTTFGPLAREHQVYALDLIGHGRTDKPALSAFQFSDAPRFLCEFMSAMNIDRAHVVGHSMGAAICMLLAMDHPARVQKLILADAPGFGKELSSLLRIMTIPGIGELLASMSYTPDVKKFGDGLRASAIDASHITDELIENLFAIEQNPTQYKITLKILRHGAHWLGQKHSFYGPILQWLPSVTTPTLLLWGRQDALVPFRHGELAASLIPNARLEIIDRCGHVPMFEQPEIFNHLLLEFLRD